MLRRILWNFFMCENCILKMFILFIFLMSKKSMDQNMLPVLQGTALCLIARGQWSKSIERTELFPAEHFPFNWLLRKWINGSLPFFKIKNVVLIRFSNHLHVVSVTTEVYVIRLLYLSADLCCYSTSNISHYCYSTFKTSSFIKPTVIFLRYYNYSSCIHNQTAMSVYLLTTYSYIYWDESQ